jgi:hypothetical protein
MDLGIEEHDQIDIAGIVQLAGAHLAHCEHEQAAALLRIVGIARRQSAAHRLLPQQISQRHLHRRDRDIGQCRRHLHDRPDAADVAQRDQQRRFRLQLPQQAHDVGLTGRGEHLAAGAADQLGQMRLRLGTQQALEAAGIGPDEIEQIGRALGNAEQDAPRQALGQQRAKRSSQGWLEFGEPFIEAMFGFVGRTDMRAGNETFGQDLPVRVSRRG